MNKNRKLMLLLLVLVAVLLVGATAAAAAPMIPRPASQPAPELPWRHPPSCRVVPVLTTDIILGVYCEDKGGDINEAFVVESNYPVQWDADFDGRSAFLQVYKPEQRMDLVLVWCVADAAGNMVIQKWSWAPTDE